MTTNDVNTILVRLAVMDAKLDGIGAENVKADALHLDHETRIRTLEAVRWKIAGWSAAIGAIGGGGVVAALSRVTGA